VQVVPLSSSCSGRKLHSPESGISHLAWIAEVPCLPSMNFVSPFFLVICAEDGCNDRYFQ
jgi:hypothetical protein